MPDPRVIVVSTGRNSARYIERSLRSIADQTYNNIEVVVVDDASDDDSAGIAEAWCDDSPGWLFIPQAVRRWALRNQFEGIWAMDPADSDVIVWVDSDDRLAHPAAIERVVDSYRRGALMTYGSYEPDPPSATCAPAQPYPQQVISANTYRHCGIAGKGILWNHLRTVSGRLWRQLARDDMVDENGEWYRCAPDSAVMYPCLELAGGRHEFIKEVLLIYTSDSPAAEWRVDPTAINRAHHHQLVVRQPKQPLRC